MQLSLSYLKDVLENFGSYEIWGNPSPEFLFKRPRFYLPDCAPEAGRLYVSDTAPSPETSLPENTALFVTQNAPALLNRIQGIFDQCEEWAATLQTASETGDIRELLDEIEFIFGNPILLHKSNFSIVACSSEVYSNEDLLTLRGSHLPYDYVGGLKRDPLFEEHRSSITVFPFTCPLTNQTALSIHLLSDSEITYRLTVIPLLRSLCDRDRFLLSLCADYVSRTLQNAVIASRSEDPTGRRERLAELFRTGVENENADQIILEQGFSSLGWFPGHHYCCLSIQIGTPDYVNHTLELLCNQMEVQFPLSCIFTHRGAIAILLNLTLSNGSVREILEKSRYFFRDNDLRCGISNEFSGFAELRNYHKQSRIALDFAIRPQTHLWTRYFSDVVLDYILEQSNRELPLHLICSRQILHLKQYDGEHQTDLYNTLECYIRNKFNAVQTARELQIHRSTFLYRMERLQTLFGLDLEQRNCLLYILLSMKMLETSKFMTLRE